MEGTRENKLAELRAKNSELEALEEKNVGLGLEINALETEEPVQ